MAGHMVSLYLKEQGYDVTGFARKKSEFVETIVGDAFDEQLLWNIIKSKQYDSVVNCIGILNREAENFKAKAVYLNTYLPHLLENMTAETKTQIIHLSTDCVFSGKRGQYTENDMCDGETFYDRSKALGELKNDKDFTIRTSIIGPDLNSDGIGLLNWFLQKEGKIWGYTKAIWTGITTLQLAKCIEFIAENRVNGLYNVVPRESISKYELLILCNHYLKIDYINILKSDQVIIDKSLKGELFRKIYKIPGYEEMIQELAIWMEEKRNLYKQYKNN